MVVLNNFWARGLNYRKLKSVLIQYIFDGFIEEKKLKVLGDRATAFSKHLPNSDFYLPWAIRQVGLLYMYMYIRIINAYSMASMLKVCNIFERLQLGLKSGP